MQVRIFTIPIVEGESPCDELNKFLRSVKVLEIRKEFINDSSGCFWSFCVLYLPHLAEEVSSTRIQRKVDYKNVLTDKQFAVFNELRKIRKHLAEDDAVPPFAVFTDAELAEISKLEKIEPSGFSHISGIGVKKIEKYGIEMCRLYEEIQNQSGE